MNPRTASLFAACAAVASCAAPQFSVAPTYGTLEPKGDMSYVSSGAAVANNSIDSLGLDDAEGTLGLRADFKWGSPHLTLATQSASWDGDGTLQADFGGISAGVPVDTELDLGLHRMVLTFDVLPTSNFELGLGFGVTVADIEAQVTKPADVPNPGDPRLTESADEVAPIPLLALRAGVRVWKIDLEALVSGLSVSFDEGDATYVEADLNGSLQFFGAPGGVAGSVMLGWRHIDIDVEYEDADNDAQVDVRFSGPYFGLKLGI